MVGHDLMDFRFNSDGTATGGSDGCMNFEDEDNMGITACLEKIYAATTYSEWCGSVSLGYFFVIAAEAVMARTATLYNADSQFSDQSLEHAFMIKFVFG